MSRRLNTVLKEAKKLDTKEQIQLLKLRSKTLGIHIRLPDSDEDSSLPNTVSRTKSITDISTLAADFWLEDETVEDVNNFIRQQRSSERFADY